jgi:hypothetical protein
VHRDPLSLAAEAIQATRCEKRDLRLVEGLAVRFHVGVAARHTVDVDLVAMTDEVREALLHHLRELDYRVGQSGGWWRAIRRDARGQHIVAVGSHPVVPPATFDAVSLRDEPVADERGRAGWVLADGRRHCRVAAGRTRLCERYGLPGDRGQRVATARIDPVRKRQRWEIS